MPVQALRNLSGDTAQGSWTASVDIKSASNAPDLGPGLDLSCSILGLGILAMVVPTLIEKGMPFIGTLERNVSLDDAPIKDYFKLSVASYEVHAELTVTPGNPITESGRLKIQEVLGQVLAMFASSISKKIELAIAAPPHEDDQDIIGLDNVPAGVRPIIEDLIRKRMGYNGADVAVIEVSPEELLLGKLFGRGADRNGHGSRMFGSERGLGFHAAPGFGGGFGG